jgi:hypothetical protein
MPCRFDRDCGFSVAGNRRRELDSHVGTVDVDVIVDAALKLDRLCARVPEPAVSNNSLSRVTGFARALQVVETVAAAVAARNNVIDVS